MSLPQFGYSPTVVSYGSQPGDAFFALKDASGGGGASTWSQFPATQDVDFGAHKINDATTITCTTLNAGDLSVSTTATVTSDISCGGALFVGGGILTPLNTQVISGKFTTVPSPNATPVTVTQGATTAVFSFPTSAANREIRTYYFTIGFVEVGGAGAFSLTVAASQFFVTTSGSTVSLMGSTPPGGFSVSTGGSPSANTLTVTAPAGNDWSAYITYTVLGSGTG